APAKATKPPDGVPPDAKAALATEPPERPVGEALLGTGSTPESWGGAPSPDPYAGDPFAPGPGVHLERRPPMSLAGAPDSAPYTPGPRAFDPGVRGGSTDWTGAPSPSPYTVDPAGAGPRADIDPLAPGARTSWTSAPQADPYRRTG